MIVRKLEQFRGVLFFTKQAKQAYTIGRSELELVVLNL